MTGLVLAGSFEARNICHKLSFEKIPAIASLAGETKKPVKLPLKTHIGGFGGVDGFKKFIQNEKSINYWRWVCRVFSGTSI